MGTNKVTSYPSFAREAARIEDAFSGTPRMLDDSTIPRDFSGTLVLMENINESPVEKVGLISARRSGGCTLFGWFLQEAVGIFNAEILWIEGLVVHQVIKVGVGHLDRNLSR